jgi:glycosyltransferase 2 family protein
MKALAKKVFGFTFRIGLSIILLGFLFRQVDEKKMFEIVMNANHSLLLVALGILLLNYILSVYRWSMLLRAVDINIPLKRTIISFSGGLFFNLFLPSTIGGDFMRSIDMATHTRQTKEVLATVFLDRLSGYVGLVIFTLASLALGWHLVADPAVITPVLIVVLILVGLLLVLFDKASYKLINRILSSPNAGKLRELITNLHYEIHIFRHKKKILIKNILISVLIQTIAPVSYYLTALALGIKIDIMYFMVFLPIIGAITLLPISIGGLGLREATVVYFFAKAGLCRDMAFTMSLLNFSFVMFYGAIGGLIYVLTVHHRRLQHNSQSPL